MSKLIRLILGTLLLVTGALALATPVRAADSQNVYFLGAGFRSGLALYFSVPDGFDWQGADKNVVINGISYELDCHVNARNMLACIAGINKNSIGQPAAITLGNFFFVTIVPSPKQPAGVAGASCTYPYDIMDHGPDDIPWGVIGTHCQSNPASVGDEIVYVNPNYGTPYGYQYFLLYPLSLPAGTENGPAYWVNVRGPIIIDDEICLDQPDC